LLFDLPERGGERLLAVFFHRGDLEMSGWGEVFSMKWTNAWQDPIICTFTQ
jgi:hypothetical protein